MRKRVAKRSLGAMARDLDSAVAARFGSPVRLSPRAAQALSVLSRAQKTPTVTHVWTALSGLVPAVGALYTRLNLQMSPRHWPSKAVRLEEATRPEMNWSSLLRRVFTIHDNRMETAELTPGARRALDTGLVTVDDLVISIIQSGRVSNWLPDDAPRRFSPNGERSRPDGPRVRGANAVLRRLMAAAGERPPRSWSAEAEAFAARVALEFKLIRESDASLDDQQFMMYSDGAGYRIRPFGSFGGYRLDPTTSDTFVARGNVIQTNPHFSADAIGSLEDLINRNALERDFQRFFEEYPQFLIALGDYRAVHPQVVLHEDDGAKLIPDFFLERLDSDFCDICDLKRVDAELVRRQPRRVRFRDTVREVLAQLENYRDWFEDHHHREEFHTRYGLHAYRPRVVAVIGRRTSFFDDVERLKLESELPAWAQIKTYDDVVAKARMWSKMSVASFETVRHDSRYAGIPPDGSQ